MQLAMVMSSSKSGPAPSLPTTCSRKFPIFRAYIWLAWTGIELGSPSGPWIATPWKSTVSPGLVSAQLPPVSAAMSTITAPGRMPATIASVTILGAGRPGTAAVVITKSTAATCSPSVSRSRCCVSADSCFA